MADGEATAGTVLKTVGPGLSAVPFVGGILSGIATGVGGYLETDAAKKQQQQAEKIRQAALRTQTQSLRPEFLQKKKMDEAAYLAGFPGYEQMKQALGEDLANSIRAIHESSPSGAAAVTAIAAVQRQKEKAMTDLGIKNGMYKADALTQLGTTTWNIGEKQRQLEDIRDKTRAQGLQAASAFDAAATYNKMGGIDKILGAVGSTATSLTKNYIDSNSAYQYGGIPGNGTDPYGNPVSLNPNNTPPVAMPDPNLFNQNLYNPAMYGSQLGANTTTYTP